MEKVNITPLIGDKAHFKRWGRFRWDPIGDTRIKILGDWQAKNIIRVEPAALAHILGRRKVWLHREVVDSFLALLSAWGSAGLLDRIVTWNGSFNPRRVRGKQSLSAHSWGVAFDVNARWNGIGKFPAAIGQKGSVMELVPLAERFGWAWGGRYPRRKDGMHFENIG